MEKTTMFIICPGKEGYEIEVPMSQWEEFEKFVQDFGEKVALPRAVKKLFLIPTEEKFYQLREAWDAKNRQ